MLKIREHRRGLDMDQEKDDKQHISITGECSVIRAVDFPTSE